jgi:epoxyqueuosine reductase QueG
VEGDSLLNAGIEMTRELKEFALKFVDKVGIANADSFAHAPKGWKPTEHLPSCKSVVVFCMKHPEVFSCSLDKSAQAYSQYLTNRALSDSAYRIGRFIEKKGFLAFPMVKSIKMFPFGKTDEYLNGRNRN